MAEYLRMSGTLTFDLEPDAATIYCEHLALEKGSNSGFSNFQEGTRYMDLLFV